MSGAGSDWYRVEGTKGVPIVLRLGDLTDDADLELYDAAGNELATSAFAGNRAELIDVTLDDGADTSTPCDPGLGGCGAGMICGAGAVGADPSLTFTCIDPRVHPCSATNP